MTGTIVQKYINALYVVMYDRAADSNGYNYWLSTVTGATSQTPVTDAIAQTMAGSFRSASSTYFNTQYSALSDSNFILALYANLGNTSSGVGGDALNYWQGRLDGFGGDRAKLAGDFTKAFLEYDGTDAAGLLRKAAFENKVAVSQAWVDASRTNAFMNSAATTDAAFAAQTRIIDGVDHTAAALQLANAQVNSVVATGNLANATGVPVANPVITLTAGTDTVTGSAQNDTIDGTRVVLSGQVLNSVNNSDSIDGGVGTDTLNVQMQEAADITLASLRNVETVSVEAVNAAGRVFNLVNSDASVQTISSANNAGVLTVSNIQSAVSNFSLANTAQNFTATVVNARLSGSSDAATLTLSNVTAGTTSLGTTSAASGYETITLNSVGTIKNGDTTDLILDDGAGTSLATVNVTGTQDLDVDFTPTTVTTVNASTFTGRLDVQFAGANGQNVTVTGGSAADIIDVQGYTTADVINGGAGSDRLVLTNAEAIAATLVQSNVSNIEVVGLSDGMNGTITVSNFGATNLRFGATMAGNGTADYAAGTNTLDLQQRASGGNALTVNVAGTATTDVLNVTMGAASTAAGNTFGAGNVTINGAETVNLSSVGAANSFGGTFTMTDTAANQALVITGNQNITFTGAVRADTIDASGMTGTATLTLTGGTGTTATVITGTGNVDALNGSTAGDIINGGAGADVIANTIAGAATAGDVLTGGAGFDTFALRGDVASAALAGLLSSSSVITDFTVGATATTTDIVQLSSTAAQYAGAGTGFHAGIAAATAVAAGSTVIQTVAQNAAAVALVTGADLFKLSTGVATTGLTAQQAFNAAIGTGTVTGLGAGTEGFVSMYDTTNSRMLLMVVDANAGTNTIVETGDTVTLIGSISMSAADYAAFGSANFQLS